MLELSGR
ncbi:hypothetical protein Q9966_004528 [Columba livia]|nr:hypothetical protein Q9966_004528 [Columba livia]